MLWFVVCHINELDRHPPPTGWRIKKVGHCFHFPYQEEFPYPVSANNNGFLTTIPKNLSAREGGEMS